MAHLTAKEARSRRPRTCPNWSAGVLHRLAELDSHVQCEIPRPFDFQSVFSVRCSPFCTVELSRLLFRHPQGRALLRWRHPAAAARADLSVMDLLFHRLTTWLAPILVFTMEEVWLERFPGDDSSSIWSTSPDTPDAWRTRRWRRNGHRCAARGA